MILELLKHQMYPPHCPEVSKPNLSDRLLAACVLRGYPVNVCLGIELTYDLLPELALPRVVSQGFTRNWGQPIDLQELSWTIVQYYPLGIIVLHQCLGHAVHFTCDENSPRLLSYHQALGDARKFQNSLVLARVDAEHGIAYAAVHVSNTVRRKFQHNP